MQNVVCLTNEQSNALQEIVNWFKYDSKIKKFWRLSGFAGTGKTSLIRYILEDPSFYKTNARPVVITPTHAAARVLRKKGVPAQTLHSLIYRIEELPDGSLICHLRSNEEIKFLFSIIVVDEASMCDFVQRNDIMKFDIPVLFVGDAGQLPPVSGDADDKRGLFMEKAESRLVTIHRNAGPISELAELIRNGGKPKAGKFGDGVYVTYSSRDVREKSLLVSDQIIVAKNTTRKYFNNLIRQIKGLNYECFPSKGEKVIVTQNYYDINLFNGSPLISIDDNNNIQISQSSIITSEFLYINEKDEEEVKVIRPYFNCIADQHEELIHTKRNELVKLDFAYAITCHKSQGSSYRKPIVISENMGNREFMKKWQYTAITRAEEKLIFCICIN